MRLSLLLVLVALLGAGVLALAAVTALRKGTTRRSAARRAAADTAARPWVVTLVAGEDPGPWPAGPVGAAAERLALDALGKVRGEARAGVVAALDDHGVGERAVRRARRRRALHRAHAAEALGALGGPGAVAVLAELVDDRSPEVRRVAARALGAVGGRDAVEPLLAALGGRRRLPAGVVAMALQRVGPVAAPALRRALGDDDPTTRYVAAELLGSFTDIDAVDELVGVLATEREVGVRTEVTRALGRIGSPAAAEILAAAVDHDGDVSVRAEAARALGRIGAVEHAERIAALLDEHGYEVPHAAATALVELGAAGRSALTGAVAGGGTAATHAGEALALAAVRR
jgi:HEAT repeat protein